MISQYNNLWSYVRDLYQNAEFGKTVDMFHIKQLIYVSNFLVPWMVEPNWDAKLSVLSFLFSMFYHETFVTPVCRLNFQ